MPCSDHRPLLEAIAGLALVAGLALACASAEPVFRLDATEADSSAVWVQGRQIVTRTAGHLRVHLAYDRTTQAGHVGHNVRGGPGARLRGDAVGAAAV